VNKNGFKSIVAISISILVLSTFSAANAADPKPNGVCEQTGDVAVGGGSLLYCRTSGKSLKWIASGPAPTGELQIYAFAGLQQTVMEKDIIPLFEQMTGVKVKGTYAATDVNLSKALSGAPTDMVWVNEFQAEASRTLKKSICPTRSEIPNEANVYPVLVGALNCYVSVGYQMTTLVYNTKIFKEKGWDPPTSWKDLFDPKYKGHVATTALTTGGYGLAAFLELAKVEAGKPVKGMVASGRTGVDPTEYGFSMLKKLKDQTLTFCLAQACLEQSLLSGQSWIGYTGHGRVNALLAQGAPLAYVIPQESTMPLGVATYIPIQAMNPNAAKAFTNFLLSPRLQKLMSDKNGWAPSVKGIAPNEGAGEIPSAAKITLFDRGDWTYINKMTPGWYKRFNQQVVG
jgi:putative spermidine/putrescine transport system substrate-binding protein